MKVIFLLVISISFTFGTHPGLVTVPLTRRIPQQLNDKLNSTFLSNSEYYSDPLTNYQQMQYYGKIQLGSNQQTFTMIFDSGSNQIWIPNSDCISSGDCNSCFTNHFNCEEYNGCRISDIKDTLKYGIGEVSGVIAQTQVSIIGIGSVTQNFLLVSKTKEFINVKADGLFGLGMYDIYNSEYVPFVKQLFLDKLINNPMFSFYLGFDSGSELTFGGFNPAKMVDPSQIYFHNIILNGRASSSQRWMIKGQSLLIGSMDIQLSNEQGIIIDSGTSFISFQKNIFQVFLNKMINDYGANEKKNNSLMISCSTDLPDLIFTLIDSTGISRNYTIPSSFYVFQLGGDICQILVMSLDIDDVSVILGDVFMRRYVTLFSHFNNTIGISESISIPTSNPSFPYAIIARILLIVGVIIGIIAWVIYKRRKQQQRRFMVNQNIPFQYQPPQYPQNANFKAFQGQGIAIGKSDNNASIN